MWRKGDSQSISVFETLETIFQSLSSLEESQLT